MICHNSIHAVLSQIKYFRTCLYCMVSQPGIAPGPRVPKTRMHLLTPLRVIL